MPLVVPQAALVRLIWSLGGSPYAVNVIGARKTGAAVVDQSLANTVGAQVKALFTSSGLAAQISNQVTLGQVGIRDISSANNAEFLDEGGAAPGAHVANLMPPQVAYCVTLRTARAGKSFRGRVYLPGWSVSGASATGSAVSIVQSTAVAFVNGLRTGLPSNGLSLAIVSRLLSSTELVTLVQGRDLIFDTIRGRATAGI